MIESLHSILLLLVAACFCFFYHYERNGNPVNLGEFISRLAWALAFSAGAFAFSLDFTVMAVCFFTGFAEIFIPHGFAQNMGRRNAPWWLFSQDFSPMPFAKYWPGFWMPHYSIVQWETFSSFKKTLFDFGGMACVGLIRGLIVFPPLFFHIDVMHCLYGVAATTLGQPLAYLIGRFINIKALNNAPDSSEWGEFLIGPAWALALFVAFSV